MDSTHASPAFGSKQSTPGTTLRAPTSPVFVFPARAAKAAPMLLLYDHQIPVNAKGIACSPCASSSGGAKDTAENPAHDHIFPSHSTEPPEYRGSTGSSLQPVLTPRAPTPFHCRQHRFKPKAAASPHTLSPHPEVSYTHDIIDTNRTP